MPQGLWKPDPKCLLEILSRKDTDDSREQISWHRQHFAYVNQQTNHCVLPVKWRSPDYSAVHRLRSNFVWEHKSHTLPLPPHCKEVQWKARQHSLCIPYNLNFSRGKQILDSTGYLDKKGKLLQLLFFPFSNQFIYFMLGEILKRIPGILCVKKLKYNHGFWKCLLLLLCAFEYFISPLSTIFYGSTSCPLIKHSWVFGFYLTDTPHPACKNSISGSQSSWLISKMSY